MIIIFFKIINIIFIINYFIISLISLCLSDYFQRPGEKG